MEENIWIRKIFGRGIYLDEEYIFYSEKEERRMKRRKISRRRENYCGTGGLMDMFNISYAMKVKNINVSNTRLD